MKLIICTFLLTISQLTHAQVFDVPNNLEAPTKTFLVSSSQPKAVVLLFIGGDGILNLQTDGSTSKENPLIRSVNLWKQYEINAILVDSPNDLGDARRGNTRGKIEHLNRVEQVAQFYKKKLDVPVYIFGHSMGTVSAIQFANQLEKTKVISGIIVAGTHIGETLSPSFDKPVLAIHHAKDRCAATPITASEAIIKNRVTSFKSQIVIIDGGDNQGIPCMGLAYHGFNKVEDQLVGVAAKFILSN